MWWWCGDGCETLTVPRWPVVPGKWWPVTTCGSEAAATSCLVWVTTTLITGQSSTCFSMARWTSDSKLIYPCVWNLFASFRLRPLWPLGVPHAMTSQCAPIHLKWFQHKFLNESMLWCLNLYINVFTLSFLFGICWWNLKPTCIMAVWSLQV